MKVIAIASNLRGTDNQMRGIILHSAKGEKIPCSKEELLTAENGTPLHRAQYNSDLTFRHAVFKSLTAYVDEQKEAGNRLPEFVTLPFGHAYAEKEGEHVDLLAKYVKEFFNGQQHPVKTFVLSSRLHDYQHVDIVNVGVHQLTKADELRLRQNPALRDKVLITEGVPGNLNWTDIKMRSQSKKIAPELAPYQGKKVALFSLGGKTANGAISFEIKDAENLLDSAKKLQDKGYEVIFTNSPRTPNEVTDYLYEHCQESGIAFYNSKNITDNPQEAEANFTVYNGKYNDEFKKQAERTGGNIYPAVLSLVENDGFVVNTWDSFSYTSDAAALSITSVVYDGNKIDTAARPDCKKLFETCLDKGYIKRLDDDFINNPSKTKPISPITNVVCAAMEKAVKTPEKTKINTAHLTQTAASRSL